MDWSAPPDGGRGRSGLRRGGTASDKSGQSALPGGGPGSTGEGAYVSPYADAGADGAAGTAVTGAGGLFAHCRDHLWELGEKSFGQLWREALDGEPDLLLDERESQILLELGEVLGRYDVEGQSGALRNSVLELGRCLAGAEEEQRRLGRVYTTLGLGSGAMLVILLL